MSRHCVRVIKNDSLMAKFIVANRDLERYVTGWLEMVALAPEGVAAVKEGPPLLKTHMGWSTCSMLRAMWPGRSAQRGFLYLGRHTHSQRHIPFLNVTSS